MPDNEEISGIETDVKLGTEGNEYNETSKVEVDDKLLNEVKERLEVRSEDNEIKDEHPNTDDYADMMQLLKMMKINMRNLM